MRFETAKDLLLNEGFRIVEDFEVAEIDVGPEMSVEDGMEPEQSFEGDNFEFIEQGLGDEGFDAQEVADIMTNYAEKINDLLGKGVEVEDIVKILAYENCPECEDDIAEEPTENLPVEDGAVEDIAIDVPVDESTLDEGKSKQKSDRFSHRMKASFKKRKWDDEEDECDDCEDIDESYEEDMAEVEDRLVRAGAARKPVMQQGSDNWDDFKDEFRAKTLFLKKVLTPQFVSGIIKDTDFEVDEKLIKEYAYKNIDEVYGTKDPVRNLQARIRKHFVG